MYFLSILVFSVAVTCDGLIIGLSYGARKIKINFMSNLIVGIISCLGTMIGMYAGQLFDIFLVESVTTCLGSVLLFLFGLYMFYQAIYKQITARRQKKTLITNTADLAEAFDKDHSKTIELKEAVMLGLFLCINNIGLGVGASLTGLNILLTSITCLILSIIFIEFGCRLTYNYLSEKTVQYAEYIASLMIMLLAIYELFF